MKQKEKENKLIIIKELQKLEELKRNSSPLPSYPPFLYEFPHITLLE
jgi:hypothetical protein